MIHSLSILTHSPQDGDPPQAQETATRASGHQAAHQAGPRVPGLVARLLRQQWCVGAAGGAA